MYSRSAISRGPSPNSPLTLVPEHIVRHASDSWRSPDFVSRAVAATLLTTSDIDQVRTNTHGPGQRFAIAAMEVCGRVLARDNEVTIHWVAAHHGVAGNERADEYAKAAASRSIPSRAVGSALNSGNYQVLQNPK